MPQIYYTVLSRAEVLRLIRRLGKKTGKTTEEARALAGAKAAETGKAVLLVSHWRYVDAQGVRQEIKRHVGLPLLNPSGLAATYNLRETRSKPGYRG
jgi:hypothetical protein